MKRELSVKHYSSPDASPQKKSAKKNGSSARSLEVDLAVWQAAGLSARDGSGAWTELWGSFVFKLVLHAVILLSVDLECGDAPAPKPKAWWGGKSVAECEPQYTFPVVLATVFLLIVWLSFGTGAHLNPSVTAGAVAAGQLPLMAGLLRVVAQVAGVAGAMIALREGAPARLHKFVAPAILLDPARAFAVEAGFTFLNVAVALSCGMWGRFKAHMTAAIVLVLICASGATMDPSGAFAASFFQRDWRHHLEVCCYVGSKARGAGQRDPSQRDPSFEWPWLAEAWGSLGHALTLNAAFGESPSFRQRRSGCWPKPEPRHATCTCTCDMCMCMHMCTTCAHACTCTHVTCTCNMHMHM